MKHYKQHIVFSLLVAFPTLFTNLLDSAFANSVSVLNIISTLLFLGAWTIYGFHVGYNRRGNFINFTLIYWGANIGIVIFQHYFSDTPLIIFPMYVIFAPMYALYYFLNKSLGSSFLIFISLITPIAICSIIGYLVGLKKRIQNV